MPVPRNSSILPSLLISSGDGDREDRSVDLYFPPEGRQLPDDALLSAPRCKRKLSRQILDLRLLVWWAVDTGTVPSGTPAELLPSD